MGIRPLARFTYRGLVEFLVLAENALDALGNDPAARQEAANQLVYDLLVEPTGH